MSGSFNPSGEQPLSPTLETILDLRHAIDLVDDAVMTALVERFALVRQMAGVKRALNIEIHDLARQRQIIERACSLDDAERLVEVVTQVLITSEAMMRAEWERLAVESAATHFMPKGGAARV